jgi:iron complex outermembrane receptor protein
MSNGISANTECQDRTSSREVSRSSWRSSPLMVVYGAGLATFAAVPLDSRAQTLMEEIIVTAQKVEQSVDAVPVAVTAISGDALRALGFQSSTDVAAQIPNVDIGDTGFNLLFAIRGITLQDFGDANESPVGFYIDDVYRGTLAGQINQIYDIERVEVLRGPQGTLYGRNTTAGLIHYLSKRPTSELDGYAQVQLGSYEQRIVEAAIGGPLGERVRARIAGKYHEDDGWQENQAEGGGKFAVTDTAAVRGQIEIDLTDSLTSLTSASYSSQDNVSPIYGYMGVLTSATSFEQCAVADIDPGRCFNLAGFRDPDPDPEHIWTELTPGEARNDADIFSVSERLTWQLSDDLQLVSLTAYETVDKTSVVDEDSSAVGAFGIGFQFHDIYTADTEQFSQEFKLTGKLNDSPWVAGVFYFDDSKDVSSTVRLLEIEPGVPDTAATVDTESWAVYVDWQPRISETVGAIAGLRYSNETKEVSAVTAGLPGSRELDTDAVTGRVGLTWSPSDDLLTYATISTGFKSGEFNTTLLFGDIDALSSADKETVTNYELGAKFGFWGERGRLRLAAFFTDIKDKQGVTIDGGSGSPATRLINYGDATSYGGEIELLLNPVDRLEISLALGLVEAEIEADPGDGLLSGWGTGANAGIGDFFELDGTDLSTVPTWTVNGVVRYGLDLLGGELTLQSDFDWQGDEKNGPGGIPWGPQESYAIVNFRALWESASDRYYGEVFVENAFDESYWQGSYIIAGFDYQSVFWGRPRWVGARAGVRFGR